MSNEMPQHSDSIQERPRSNAWLRFAVALGCIAVLWLMVLPWLTRREQIAEHIQLQQQQRIDPSAMYYSELEILPAIAHRVERLHEYYGFAYRPGTQPAITRSRE